METNRKLADDIIKALEPIKRALGVDEDPKLRNTAMDWRRP